MDLTTNYLGMALKSPLVPSASPLSRDLDTIRRLEDAGAAALVMHSLFEEQIALEGEQLDHYLSYFTDAFAESLTFYPDQKSFHVGPDEYLESIRKAKAAVKMPIIGSLNGISDGGWTRYASEIEKAGADALELNVYYLAADPAMSSAKVESMVVEALKAVKQAVHIPIAVKLSPYFSSLAGLSQNLVKAGADGLVLFNRFYQPDIDLENLDVTPTLSLSTSDELRLPLRWIAILYGRVNADLALTTGVHTYEDVFKGLMAGAKVTMLCSELLHKGVGRITEIESDMRRWMDAHEYESVQQMQGSVSQKNIPSPAAFERANYMRVLQSWRPDPAGNSLSM